MKVIFIPMFRVGVSYTVTVGRRWSILDKMLLAELATGGWSVQQLAVAANLPDRIVVESLINLLRANLIEVRTGTDGAVFTATAVGKRRAVDGELRPELRREIRWMSLCMDRLTGCWLRSEDLDLVPSHNLPEEAHAAAPLLTTLNYDDPEVRGLVTLRPDEDLDGFEPSSRQSSSTFARIGVSYDEIVAGLPPSAPFRLQTAIREAVADFPAQDDGQREEQPILPTDPKSPRDTITADDVIVGGPAHLEALRSCLASARTHAIIHSCFVNPETVKLLLPDIERAARRRVRVDCLWGLRDDPEDSSKARPIIETFKLFEGMTPAVSKFVSFCRTSSNSHAKVVIYDDKVTGKWVSVVGSCNFLSSNFDSLEISIRSRSQRLAAQLMSELIAAQIPASGALSNVARRLGISWNGIRKSVDRTAETGIHSVQLVADADHYASVTMALDRAENDIVIGCDLYGAAAETSVLVPLEAAARGGVRTRIYYHRLSRYMEQEGCVPDGSELTERGIDLIRIPELHGKFLAWDDCCVLVTSFNWLATVSKDVRARGAELGLAISGPGTRDILARKLLDCSGGKMDIGLAASVDVRQPALTS